MSTVPSDILKLTPHQAKNALEAGALLIDLRPHEAFAGGHIPGSINVAFSRKSLPERVATAIPSAPPIVLLAGDEAVAEAATEALQGLDRNPLQGILTAGSQAWEGAGLPLANMPQVSATALRQRLHAPHDDLVLIDVREPFEWELGYIDGALLIPLGEIWQRASALDPCRDIILICEEGIRSSTGASILLHHGFQRAGNVPGGMGDWFKANYPTIRLPKPPKR